MKSLGQDCHPRSKGKRGAARGALGDGPGRVCRLGDNLRRLSANSSEIVYSKHEG
ncbi:hypothetical protein ES707_12585 [subsurface metagenome]